MTSLLQKLWNSPTFTTWGSFATRLLSVTLVLPMMLTKLEPSEVAVMQLFASILAILMMLDFGLSPTLARMYSYAMGGATVDDLTDITKAPKKEVVAPNHEALRAVYGTLRWLYLRVAVVLTIGMGLIGTWLLIKPISQVADTHVGWIAWGITLLTSSVSVWGNVYNVVLMGGNQIAPMRRWETVFATCQILCTFAILHFGGKLLVLVLANQAWLVINVLRNRWLVRQLQPELNHVGAKAEQGVIQPMWPATWRSGIGILMSQGIIQSSGLVYSQFAPAKDVAAYLLALRLITLISQLSSVPFYTKLPLLGQLLAGGRKPELVRIAQKSMAVSHWLFVAGAAGVLYTASPLLTFIGSKVNFVSGDFWVVMALAFFAERYGAMHIHLYSVSNRIIWHIANGITGAIMIAGLMVLYPWLKDMALPAAMAMAYIGFYAWYCAVQSIRFSGQGFFAFEKSVAIPPILILMLGAGIHFLHFPGH